MTGPTPYLFHRSYTFSYLDVLKLISNVPGAFCDFRTSDYDVHETLLLGPMRLPSRMLPSDNLCFDTQSTIVDGRLHDVQPPNHPICKVTFSICVRGNFQIMSSSILTPVLTPTCFRRLASPQIVDMCPGAHVFLWLSGFVRFVREVLMSSGWVWGYGLCGCFGLWIVGAV